MQNSHRLMETTSVHYPEYIIISKNLIQWLNLHLSANFPIGFGIRLKYTTGNGITPSSSLIFQYVFFREDHRKQHQIVKIVLSCKEFYFTSCLLQLKKKKFFHFA